MALLSNPPGLFCAPIIPAILAITGLWVVSLLPSLALLAYTAAMRHAIDPTIDCVFKALLGSEANRALLIHFLNATLGADLAVPIAEVEILNPYNEREFLDDKLSIVDVKACDQNQESGVEFARPVAATAEQLDTATLLVGIDAQQRIWIDRRQVELAALRPLVEQRRAEHPQGGAVIQADASAETGLLVKVLDHLRLAGIDRVAVAVERP